MKERIKYIAVVVIAIIIIGIGMTYSYFRVGVSEEGRGEEVIVDTAEIMRTKLTISGEIEFQDQDIYPGHKNVSSIKVEATGEDRVVYNVVWRGENTLNTPLKYYVYKTSSKKDPKISCSKRIEGNVVKKYYEECIEEGFEELGSIIGEGTITNTKEMKFILKDQEEIEANPEGKEVYYYVVIEYPNLDEDQYPLDKGGKFQGEVGIEVLSGTAIKPEIKNITTSKTENSITIGVEASDNSGIGGYYYKIGKEEYVRRDEATYTFSGLEEYKEYEIRVYVEDIYGNRSEEEVRKVRTEDVTSPQIIITNNVKEGENGWYKSVEVIGEARDEGAGVSKVKYCVTTGSTCTPNTEISNQGEVRLSSNTNSQKVCYEAEDGSGNKSKVVCSGGYKVDQDQPTVVISSTSSTESTITINLSGRDSHSGIQSYKYSINNGAYIKTTDSTHTFTGLESGTSYSIKVQVVDKAGNVSSELTTNVITEKPSAKDTILANYPTIKTRTLPLTTSTIITDTTTGVIYKAEDDWGDTYYFAGNPTDNWLKFAGYYWRIIRINGDGSIRLIYNGTSTATTGGDDTLISIGQSFGVNYRLSEYVGYMYTLEQQHGNTSDSSIKETLDDWYSSNLASYTDKISKEAGFCGDREMASGYEWSSDPISPMYYVGRVRLAQNSSSVNPTFKCSNSADLYTVSGSSKGNKALTYPIGLITADEVIMAGGSSKKGNSSYYLYNNDYYWTMTPYHFHNSAVVFRVGSGGMLDTGRTDYYQGVRPVINLASDVKVTGSGTSTDPYVVVGAS